jgi:quercetin 2,3-dioxygenase
MLRLRRSADRGHADHGWLDSHHSFSFSDYYDPAHMGFGKLRVINEDRVAPGAGFPTHGHRDMEILSYVIDGALEHADSIGTGAVISRGELQRMSAGTGVRHSEYNASKSEPVHFLQIWIQPERAGLEPGYEQRFFEPEGRTNRLRLLASRDGREGSLTIHQDVALYGSLLEAGQSIEHAFAPGRRGWLQLVAGELEVGGESLEPGDGLAISDETSLHIRAKSGAELLLFDLA